MSKKTRKRKKKPPIKTSLPKPKAEPKEEVFTVKDAGKLIGSDILAPSDEEIEKIKAEMEKQEVSEYTIIPSPTPAQDVLLAILKQAPELPWKIDKTYINGDFRKQYVDLLRKLVNMLGLPYTVDQAGTLTAK